MEALSGAWRTRSGAPVLIRPIGTTDFSQLRQFMRTLSLQTRYKRFLSPRTPTDQEIGRWTAIDPSREYSLVALAREGEQTLLGEARYVVDSSGDADVAIVIADRWQGLGLGRELMTRLIAAARSDELRRLTGLALSTNSAVLALAQKLGFRFSRTPGAGWETTLSLDLRP